MPIKNLIKIANTTEDDITFYSMMVFLSYILVQLYKVFRRIFKKRIDGLLFVQAMIRKTAMSIRGIYT